MSTQWMGLIELLLVLGLVLGFGFWELYSLRRDKKRSQETAKRDEGEPKG